MYGQVYRFEESAGQTQDERGKTSWPHMLRVKLGRDKLKYLMMYLSQKIDSDEPIELCFSGELTTEEDEPARSSEDEA